jgi:hypothetical protein
MAIENNNDRLDRAAAAKFLGVSVAFLAADVITGRHKIPFCKVGRRCVYLRSQLDAWMSSRMVNTPAS